MHNNENTKESDGHKEVNVFERSSDSGSQHLGEALLNPNEGLFWIHLCPSLCQTVGLFLLSMCPSCLGLGFAKESDKRSSLCALWGCRVRALKRSQGVEEEEERRRVAGPWGRFLAFIVATWRLGVAKLWDPLFCANAFSFY